MRERRRFLRILAGAAIGSAVRGARGATTAVARRRPIRAVAFDLFTIFDPRSVAIVADTLTSGRGRELCELWRARQFEYTWLRTAAGTYRDFHALTQDALAYAARAAGIGLSPEASHALVAAYERLNLWPDSALALEGMKSAGLRLAPLANFTQATIESLLARAGIRQLFDTIISTDRAKTFKPDPRAYALGPAVLRLPRDEIAFAAFGGWDAAGARWFGYPTFWVNRLGAPAEELPPGPDAVGSTLTELASWLTAR